MESISERLVKQYGQEFRDLDDGECAAALFAAATAFDDDAVFDTAKTDLMKEVSTNINTNYG